MKRGTLTEEINNTAKKFLNRELSTTELRLYPYIDYCIKNTGAMQYSKINKEELEILEMLENEGYIYRHTGGMGTFYIAIRKDFYDFIQEILWLAYVEIKIEEETGSEPVHYTDKDGNEIKEGSIIHNIHSDEYDFVFSTTNQYGEKDLGINATNVDFLDANPDYENEFYPLYQFDPNDLEVIQGTIEDNIDKFTDKHIKFFKRIGIL